MNRITVKKLQLSDWKVYKSIQLEALKNNQESFATPYEKMVNASEEKWQERFHSNSMIFVAIDGDAPVGLIGIYLPPESKEKKPDVWGMYVNSKYRGSGVGQMLMKTALDEVQKEWGMNHFRLMVNEDQVAAIKFYEKWGFKKVGSQEYVLGDGKKHNVLVMEKEKTIPSIRS